MPSKPSTNESRKMMLPGTVILRKAWSWPNNGTKLVNLEMTDINYMEWADHFIMIIKTPRCKSLKIYNLGDEEMVMNGS